MGAERKGFLGFALGVECGPHSRVEWSGRRECSHFAVGRIESAGATGERAWRVAKRSSQVHAWESNCVWRELDRFGGTDGGCSERSCGKRSSDVELPIAGRPSGCGRTRPLDWATRTTRMAAAVVTDK